MKNNNMMPLVSVIVPCYNHERYIIECLQSIYECDYKNIELIVIDDGSIDNSYTLANKWLNQNSNRFVHSTITKQENHGICKTLNKLIASSSGEYIVAVASDDRLFGNAIKTLLSILMKKKKDIIITDVRLIDLDGELISESAFSFFSKPINQFIKNWIFEMDILLNWEAPYQHIMVRRDVYLNTGMYNEEFSFEDREFILRALSNKNLTYCPVATKDYRIRLDNRLTPSIELKKLTNDLSLISFQYYKKFSGIKKYIMLILYMKDLKADTYLQKIQKFFAFYTFKTITFLFKKFILEK